VLSAQVCFHILLYNYPFSTPAENAVNKRIIEHHTPTALSSVKPPFWWCVSGITTFFYHISGVQFTEVISVIFEYRVEIQPVIEQFDLSRP